MVLRSPDRSPALCDAWAEKDQRIHVIHKANGGLSDARNAGIEMAQGDFLTFIDSDDYIEAGTLACVMAAVADNDIVEYPVDGFCGSSKHFQLIFHPTIYEDMANYSNQKLSALLRMLVKAGRVVKTVDKKKSYFSVNAD